MEAEIDTLHEFDGEFAGKVVGCFINGHVDKNLFFETAKLIWLEEEREKLEYDQIDEMGDCPFNINTVKHLYYRHATWEDIEKGDAEDELQFLTLDHPKERYTAYTVVDFP